jgi:6-pyruvoyltetrahydropterin/6-carboxytetrahydropterin synthase
MQISKYWRFEAAHILPRHPGRCARLHGHSFRLRVEIEGPVQPDSQFVMDYAELSKIVEPIVERFDHRFLNLYVQYPSAENLAIHIAHELRPMLSGMDRIIVAVSETEKTWAIWDSRRTSDMRIFDDPESSEEWKAPKLERIITDLKVATARIEALERAAKKNLEAYSEQMTEVVQLHMYLDSLRPIVKQNLVQ